MTAARTLRPTVAAVTLALVAAACAAGHVAAPVPRSRPVAVPVAAPAAVGAPTDAVQLRSSLEMALGAHVLFTVDLMRDRLRGTKASLRAQAALDAVTSNTQTLSTAVGSLFGSTAATTFTELWSAHVRELADYAGALAAHDEVGQQRDEADLRQTEADLATFLSTASGGRLPAAAARAAVTMHVTMLLEQARSYARNDYASSYRVEAEGFDHMLTVADTLASALAQAKGLPAGDLSSPRRQLQSALARLFAEHMGIVVEAMRSDADGAPDFVAIGDTLNANTAALGAAIGALYGQPAAAAFLKLWAAHVDALIAYADAVRNRDAGARQAAQRALDEFATNMAQFLATATNGRLPAVQLTGALTEHDTDLTSQLDAYANGDAGRAEQVASMGYEHMFALAETLAVAIGNTVAARLPHGGAQTGGGGTARR